MEVHLRISCVKVQQKRTQQEKDGEMGVLLLSTGKICEEPFGLILPYQIKITRTNHLASLP